MLHHKYIKCNILYMKLDDYIRTYPPRQRRSVKKALAESLGVKESTIASWANGYRKVNQRYHDALKENTGGKVTDFSKKIFE